MTESKHHRLLILSGTLLVILIFTSKIISFNAGEVLIVPAYSSLSLGNPNRTLAAHLHEEERRNFVRHICTYEQRQDYISKMCSDFGSPQSGGNRLLVDRVAELLQCAVPKAAGTTWKTLWEHAHFSHYTNSAKKFKNTTRLSVHASGMRQAGLQFHSIVEKLQFSLYTKFIVVRNPFERIYSAYVNTAFRKRNTPGPSPAVTKYLHEYNLKHNRPANITLQQFLELILNDTDNKQQLKYKMDRHWAPYTYTCDLCNIKYDYIMRVETMKYDSGPILSKLGYPRDFFLKQNANLNPYSSLQKKQQVQKLNQVFFDAKVVGEYKKLPRTLLHKFIKMYWYDFVLLGYSTSLEENTTIAQCTGNIDTSGYKCC